MSEFRGKKALVGLIAVFLGLVAGGLLMLTSGDNPFAGYGFLFRGSFELPNRIAYSSCEFREFASAKEK